MTSEAKPAHELTEVECAAIYDLAPLRWDAPKDEVLALIRRSYAAGAAARSTGGAKECYLHGAGPCPPFSHAPPSGERDRFVTQDSKPCVLCGKYGEHTCTGEREPAVPTGPLREPAQTDDDGWTRNANGAGISTPPPTQDAEYLMRVLRNPAYTLSIELRRAAAARIESDAKLLAERDEPDKLLRELVAWIDRTQVPLIVSRDGLTLTTAYVQQSELDAARLYLARLKA